MSERRPLPTLLVAAALALGAAISLGLTRFSYALLLPAMRADLGWSYLTAGMMNTVNAAGYLVGALLTPLWLRRGDARTVFLAGCAATATSLLAHGLVTSDSALYLVRFVAGVSNALVFIAGGLLAARLATAATTATTRVSGSSSGLVLGVYYGGTGLGIVVSALVVPPSLGRVVAHPWQGAWLAFGALAFVATGLAALATTALREAAPTTPSTAPGDQRSAFAWQPLAAALLAYLLFGLGYIGYMTFVISLLREEQVSEGTATAFFALLGLAVMASPWIWAAVLQRFRGGGALALLCGLVALATLAPVLSAQLPIVFASGLLFGAVLLAVVASTTALVRHNLAPSGWAAGIGAFTIVFAAGQIVGPSLVGLITDRFGGLRAGFALSAAVLAIGALVATRQKPLGGA
jgi:predicted MFS family arabinose efflux permease